MFRHIMEIFGPSEVFEPSEVFGETTDRTGVFLPGKHCLISWKRMIRKDLTRSFNLTPIYWPFLNSVDIVVTVV